MKKPIFVITILLMATILIVACQPAAPAAPAAPEVVIQTQVVQSTVVVEKQVEVAKKGPITIGYGAPSLDSFQTNVMLSMGNYAQQKGWQVVTSNANFDANAQANEVEYWLSLGVNAIVLVPIDSQAICASVKKSKDAGVPFFTIDRGPIGCKVDMTVQADNVLAGKQAGEAVVAFLKSKNGSEKGTVLELQGDMGQNVAQLRSKGFNDVMKMYSGITVISKNTQWKSDIFQQATLDVVGSQPIDAIYMHSDSAGAAPVMAALDQLKKKVKAEEKGHIFVAAIDGSGGCLENIRAGFMDMCASQPGPDFGILTEYVDMALKGETIKEGPVTKEGALWSPATIVNTETGPQLNLATTIVTKDNVDSKALWGNVVK